MEPLGNPFTEAFAKLFNDSSSTNQSWCNLSFKFNIDELLPEEVMNNIELVISYVSDLTKTQKFFMAIGKHDMGVNEVPHIHLHFVTSGHHTSYRSSNESRRRTKFINEFGSDSGFHSSLSLKIKNVEDIHQAQRTLQYSWKEKKPIFLEHPPKQMYHMPEVARDYLVIQGNLEFQASLESGRKKARASQRNKTLLGQVLALTQNINFDTWNEFKNFIYPKFYEGLEIDEYPEHNTLQSAIRKVAIYKQIVTPSHFEKY